MLELKNISKNFHNSRGIKNLNIIFKEGEITGILGRNGSGKTTLLKSILGLLELNNGSILFHQKNVYEQYEQVCFISADGSYLPFMSASSYGQFLKKYYPNFSITRYNELLKRFELEVYTRIKDLSKGQQMKVEIAAGFSMNATLMILDEPFTSLDVYAKEDTMKLIINEVKEDTIILVSTHDIEEIEQIADRCVVLDQGSIVEDIQLDSLHEKGAELKELLEKYRPKSIDEIIHEGMKEQ